MADEKKSQSKSTASTSDTKTSTSPSKIEVVGPKDNSTGTTILRFVRDAESKDPIDIMPGQVLTVGGNSGDITKGEAERLLAYDRWEFKEVN